MMNPPFTLQMRQLMSPFQGIERILFLSEDIGLIILVKNPFGLCLLIRILNCDFVLKLCQTHQVIMFLM